MYYGLFEMYKIGIGPSSSHTFGPMVGANMFVKELQEQNLFDKTTKITVTLFGSLSATGRGHLTDQAIILGLSGNMPESVDLDKVPSIVSAVTLSNKINLAGLKEVLFELVWSSETLKLHENGMQFSAYEEGTELLTKRYYSLGGGFVSSEEDFGKTSTKDEKPVPFAFNNAAELIELCKISKMSDVLLANEKALRSEAEIYDYSRKIRGVMRSGIHRGVNTSGNLPAPTSLTRRAKDLFDKLQNNEEKASSIMIQMDWINVFALAVSEENGAGGRVVTAPTMGSCGVIPSILTYHDRFISPLDDEKVLQFYLVSAAIGSIFKRNASIAGAEVGCQGEVGVASAMAAAGLAALYNASATKICMAAEIAMEHHLGLTCDPVNGQVQIPCIERNAVAAVTAIDATAMALSRNESARVGLDEVVETMLQTGKDMDPKYRETACGGLAKVVS